MAQSDFKRLVAYSSVSHMGYVVLGLGVWSMGSWYYGGVQPGEGGLSASVVYNPEYFSMGVKGAMFQMIAHGISSAGMFFMVGVIYDRVHHRNLNEFGGLFGKMPGYTAMAMGLFFAGLGLPGLCGFIGEVLVVLSVWKFSIVLAVISASVVVLTAGYILWALQRVYLGAEYKGPHAEALVPMKAREWAVALPLFVLAILFGIFPSIILRYMDATIDQQTTTLAEWTEEFDEEERQKRSEMADADQPADPAPAAPNDVGLEVPNEANQPTAAVIAPGEEKLVAQREHSINRTGP
jgi:NADH-quinone oxidoreductase subunit M